MSQVHVLNKNRNKASSFLRKAHNEQIFALLGHRCVSLATTPVHLVIVNTNSEGATSWLKKDEDVLCLVKDYSQRNFYFRLYSLAQSEMIWEKSLTKIHHIGVPDVFYALEGEGYFVKFNFTSDVEAKEMDEVVHSKLLRRNQIEQEKREKKQTQVEDTQQPRKLFKLPLNIFSKKMPNKFSKTDIGAPMAPQHLNSVGWDADSGFKIGGLQTHNNITENEKYLVNSAKYVTDFIKDFIIDDGTENEGSTNHIDIPNIIQTFGGPEMFLKGKPKNLVPPLYADMKFMDSDDLQHLNNGMKPPSIVDDEAMQKFIMDFISKHDSDKPVAKTKTAKRPPHPPAPQPPKLAEIALPSPCEQLDNENQIASTSKELLFDMSSENEDDSENKQKSETWNSEPSLITVLAAALKQRSRALHSDDSAESYNES